MFYQPPTPTEEEIRAQETEASSMVQRSVFAAALLYLAPFVIESAKGFF